MLLGGIFAQRIFTLRASFSRTYTRMSRGSPLKWGFLGGGKITNEFVSAINELPKCDHNLIAIACRNLQDAQNFANLHGIPRPYGSYDELYKDPEVDLIYIGTVNSFHYDQAVSAIKYGKHVLVEKPFCLTGKEAKELVRLARENKVFLMEGFWTRFFPAFRKFMKDIEAGRIGQIHQMLLTVGNTFSELERFRIRELGGGSLMNHACYGIQFATRLFGKPDKVFATGLLSDTGVDLDTTFVMSYSKIKASATTVCTSLARTPGELYAMGTKGFLRLPYPCWTPSILESSAEGVEEFPLPPITGKSSRMNIGFVYEAEEIRRCIQNGLLESPEMPLDESVMVYEICDEIRRQLGVCFPQDGN